MGNLGGSLGQPRWSSAHPGPTQARTRRRARPPATMDSKSSCYRMCLLPSGRRRLGRDTPRLSALLMGRPLEDSQHRGKRRGRGGPSRRAAPPARAAVRSSARRPTFQVARLSGVSGARDVVVAAAWVGGGCSCVAPTAAASKRITSSCTCGPAVPPPHPIARPRPRRVTRARGATRHP